MAMLISDDGRTLPVHPSMRELERFRQTQEDKDAKARVAEAAAKTYAINPVATVGPANAHLLSALG